MLQGPWRLTTTLALGPFRRSVPGIEAGGGVGRTGSRRLSVVLLSGGVDSATVAALLVDEKWDVEGVFVDYGQLATTEERVASRRIADHYRLRWTEVAVRGLEVPAFREVRGRNDLLLAVASAASAADGIAIGTHAGTPYADCSGAHAAAWQSLLDAQHGGTRRLLAPLRSFSKPEVVALARRLDVPLSVTYSCEDAGGPCGRCTSCRDREHALAGT
jgi:7-cyano-7-deazaguanine synthase